ncbi:MATE family efflux transporter [Trinickia fusca]|nr:MATE family efflux transporter [Trinickia fusca]
MAIPIAIGMIFQALYYVVDLYFVGKLGKAALAGVGAAGNGTFLVLALTQVLGVGNVALISQAAGRKDRDEANLVFNQSLTLATVAGLAVLILGYALTTVYLRSIAADAAIVDAGRTYLYWYMPGLALQFALAAMGSTLRGTGIVQPTLTVQLLSIVLNAILAPILIAGWFTHRPMGVAGAGLASTLATAFAVLALWGYFHKLERYVGVKRELLAPRLREWGRMLAIGLPAGGEYALMFVFAVIGYWAIRDFGPAAQAGYGTGSRIIQGLILPGMAIAFATGPIIGQNFGAGRADRVRDTFRSAVLLISLVMAPLSVIVYTSASSLIGGFAKDADVVAQGSVFLRVVAWNFVAQGVIFTCSSVFQGLGNTRPSLLSSSVRLLIFALPTIWIATHHTFRIELIWHLSVASVFIQACVSLLLLRQQFDRRLVVAAASAAA